MSNPNVIQVKVLVRDGARGTQAMWAAYHCPRTGKPITLWGTVKTPAGDKPYLKPGSQPRASLLFNNSKEIPSRTVSRLYQEKGRKYDELGWYELTINQRRIDPVGTHGQKLAADAQRAGLNTSGVTNKATPGNAQKPPLPREVTHPEAMKSGQPTSPGWFF